MITRRTGIGPGYATARLGNVPPDARAPPRRDQRTHRDRRRRARRAPVHDRGTAGAHGASPTTARSAPASETMTPPEVHRTGRRRARDRRAGGSGSSRTSTRSSIAEPTTRAPRAARCRSPARTRWWSSPPTTTRSFGTLDDDAGDRGAHRPPRPRPRPPRRRARVRPGLRQPGQGRGRVDRAPARAGGRARPRASAAVDAAVERFATDRPRRARARRRAPRRARGRRRARAGVVPVRRVRRRTACASRTAPPAPASTRPPTPRSASSRSRCATRSPRSHGCLGDAPYNVVVHTAPPGRRRRRVPLVRRGDPPHRASSPGSSRARASS